MNSILKKIFFCFSSILIISCSSESEPSRNRMAASDNIIHDNLPVGNSPELNGRRTGLSANELLSDSKYKSLTIETLSVEGMTPSQPAIDSLINFINKRCHKPNGIKIINKVIPKPEDDDGVYSTIEVAEIEIKNRTAFSKDDDIAIHIFFADRENENTQGDLAILGTAYLNTSIVIYETSIRRLTNNSFFDTFDITKAATLTHEFCHLLGLVNVGTPMVEDHEAFEENDEGERAGGHCNIPGCLMEAQTNFFINAEGNFEVNDLDELCIQDLKANGGK